MTIIFVVFQLFPNGRTLPVGGILTVAWIGPHTATPSSAMIGGCSSSALKDPAGGSSGRGKYSKGV